jgi:hypothetical protein
LAVRSRCHDLGNAPSTMIHGYVCLFCSCSRTAPGHSRRMQRYDGPPMTLGNMRAHGVRSIEVYCQCGREEQVVVDALPDEVAVPSLKERFRCVRCGMRPQLVRPAWGDTSRR